MRRLSALLSLSLTAAAIVSCNQAPAPSAPTIELGSAQLQLSGSVGSTLNGTATVKNTGSVAVQYSVSVPKDATWLSVAPSSGSVQPGGQADLTVSASCPADAGTLSTTVTVTASAGSASATSTFTVTVNCTSKSDNTPDAFSFAPKLNVEPGAVVVSDPVTITGIGSAVPISVVGGEYRIGTGDWTSAPGSITAGQTLTLRHIASTSYSQDTTTTVTVGGVSASFKSTTRAESFVPDSSPDAFSFPAVTDAGRGAVVTSAPITVGGINVPVPIAITGGEYRIGNGAWTGMPGTVQAGNQVQVRLTAPASYGATASALLTVGDQQASFSVTTAANVAPVASDVNGGNVDQDTTVTVTLNATDANGDALSYSITTPPDHGSASVSGNVLTYSAPADYSGPVTIGYTASDGSLTSNAASVTFSVVNTGMLYVSPSGNDANSGKTSAKAKLTIGAALAAAQAGDTINLAAGSYTEGSLTIGKAVTLKGPNAGTAGTAARVPEAVLTGDVTLNATGAVLDGLRFESTDDGRDHALVLILKGSTVQNSVFFRQGADTGKAGPGVRGVTITGNVPDPVTITRNLFQSVGSLYTNQTFRSGVYFNGGSTELHLTSNTFKGNRAALNIDDASRDYDITDNDFGVSGGPNGTAISYGGSTPTTGSFSLSGNRFASYTNLNLSNVDASFRLDASANTFDVGTGAKTPASMNADELAVLEDTIDHGPDGGSKNGLVVVKAGNVYARPGTGGTSNLAKTLTYVQSGQTLNLLGTFNLGSTFVVDRAVKVQGAQTSGAGNTQINVTASIGYAIQATVPGITLDGLHLTKTDQGNPATPQNLIYVAANNFTATNNIINGQLPAGGLSWTTSNQVTRAFEVAGNLSGLNLSGNTIYNLRQPAYINPDTTGVVNNNVVYGSKGWVLDGAPVSMTGNSWNGTYNESADISLLNRCSNPAFVAIDAAALAAANSDAIVSDQRTCP